MFAVNAVGTRVFALVPWSNDGSLDDWVEASPRLCVRWARVPVMRGGNGERKASERSSSEDDSWLADINLAERISQSPLVQWIQWDSVRNGGN